jgi:anti-sigma B factor antagonist
LKVVTRMEGEIAVITVSGRLVGGPDADAIPAAVRERVEQGVRRILIDIGDVSWINSTGLGILISARATAGRVEAALKLSRVSHRVRQLFMVTRLHQVFDAYETNEEALRSFAAGAPE